MTKVIILQLIEPLKRFVIDLNNKSPSQQMNPESWLVQPQSTLDSSAFQMFSLFYPSV